MGFLWIFLWIFPSTNPLLNARSMASTIHVVRFPKAPPPTALRYTSADG